MSYCLSGQIPGSSSRHINRTDNCTCPKTEVQNRFKTNGLLEN